MNRFDGTEKIGDIVSIFPGASNLFKQFQIDFCCGGNRELATVLRQMDLNGETFLAGLNEAYEKANRQAEQDTDWRNVSYADLISHVVNTHHAYLNNELPVLSQFVTKILRVHGRNHPELTSLHRVFHQLKMDLEQHLVSEEEVVFPLILEYEKTGSVAALEKALQKIDELESEHDDAGDLLKEMRKITDRYTLPEGACRTYTLTFQKLEQLESDMFQHVHLENNIMFPRLREELKN
ncbi:iron-sulfur cluster repair di-iron protein [Thermoactinomyces mirandus]|uniref:Iron-sulfur cluster repair di-iron protein n=1 Tax=Thermoactinomyces mirandus TaxID=2756294 RepID=A0A7W2ARJ8_9BACL|nr:iron-sulfur cluster repair di-iron protein [Thermoactinomyces mirandus]MBA4602663.1 iron-sulfur cluster repair di-iron protein [Thermoactinomyces mirandus]